MGFQKWPKREPLKHFFPVPNEIFILEEKGLIRTQPTKVFSRDGKTLNGNLLFTICPIQAAVQAFYERQLSMADLEMERYQAQRRMDHLHKREGETVC